jgi:hypothetical protein
LLEHFTALEYSAWELSDIDCYDDYEGRLRCPRCSGIDDHEADCSLVEARAAVSRRELTERMRAILTAADAASAARSAGRAEPGQAHE